MKNFSPKRGFTLIEVLVVIAIIGILSTVIMIALNEARANARDKTRIADLEQIKAAMHIYAVNNGTYRVAGAGSGGQGWFAYEDGAGYPESIADELYDLGLLTSVMHDPLVPAGEAYGGPHRQYMNYFQTGGPTVGTCLLAQLENPSDAQRATLDNAPLPASSISTYKNSYKMNYASCTS